MSALRRLGRAVLLCLACCGSAAAAPAPWPAAPFQYFAKQAPLARVLTDFTKAFGLRLELSPQADGRLNGNYAVATPTQFLDALAASYGLTWYYHGGVLYVDKASESLSRSVRAGKSEIGMLKTALVSLGVLDSRFGWGEFPERGVVIFSGPPAYLKHMLATIGELGVGARVGSSAEEELRVFLLKHTRAEDRTFTYRDQHVVTPGVATILRSLVAGQTAQSRIGTSSATVPALRRPGAEPEGKSESRSEPKGGNDAAAAGSRAVIEVDQRLNAVIVRDTPERINAYSDLVRQLDVPTPLIEIEAIIVDINSDEADKLGINWTSRDSKGMLGFGNPTAAALGTLTLSKGDSAGVAAYFLANVDALASKGQARVLARPSVLTADNLVAVLDLSQTLYMSVVGERVADVVPVATGTLLKVTPRVIDQGGQRMVQLVVDIEDGSVVNQGAGKSPPTVVQSNISTQAVVRENDSLLIGGYTRESDNSSLDAVPLLGSVPLLGNLFRHEQRASTRLRRVFLIRPRIVENPAALPFPAEAPLPATPALEAPVSAAPRVSVEPVAMTVSLPAPVRTGAEPGDAGTAAPSAAAPLATADGAAERAVLARLAQWSQAWSGRQMVNYLACYSPQFAPADGSSRAAWVQQRHRRIMGKEAIKVEVEAPQVNLQGDTARVSFWQKYVAGKKSERSRKTLLLEKRDGDWTIRAELNEG